MSAIGRKRTVRDWLHSYDADPCEVLDLIPTSGPLSDIEQGVFGKVAQHIGVKPQ
jgi:hypothetical protein